jgi:hypothetical protein
MTYTATQQGISGTENIDLSSQSPGFINAGGGNYRLGCTSICRNEGSAAALDEDSFDVDEDSYDDEEYTPDLDKAHRVVGAVDMGCYETQRTSPCITPHYADVSPLPCTDGLVNIDDLLLIINNWGPCQSVAMFCPGDIVVNSYNQIDLDDLLAVINAWSGYCVGESYNAGSLSSVEDCMDAATAEELEPYSPEWDEFVNKCVEGLCAAEIIDCD